MKKFISILVVLTIIFVSGCSKLPDAREISSGEQKSDPLPSDSHDNNDENKTTEPSATPTASEGEHEQNATDEPTNTIEPSPDQSTPKASTPKPSTSNKPSSTPKTENEPTEKPKVNEHIRTTPQILNNNICISPKYVYYKDSYLYMEAFVSNGFNHTVYNLRDISIRLSNKNGVIADAYFPSMQNAIIEPNSYIIWTFVFGPDTINLQNADLSYLETTSKITNSY